MTDINKLREELADIDRNIMELIGRRNSIAEIIGTQKATEHKAIVVPNVEDIVIQRYIDAGELANVSATTSSKIARAIIDESVSVQGKIPRATKPRKIFIIGGNGGMGKWLTKFFTARGHTVTISSRDPKSVSVLDIPTGCATADVIILSTPIPATAEILEKVLSLNPNALIFDILSIKSPIISILRKGTSNTNTIASRICSVHPMFGPGAPSIGGRNVVICDCGDKKAVNDATELFDGGKILHIPVEQHDMFMAYVLGLPHALNLAFSDALTKSGFTAKELHTIASTTFQRQITISHDVSEENAELYYAIQRENMWNDDAVRNLIESLKDLQSITEKEFSEKMKTETKWYNSE